MRASSILALFTTTGALAAVFPRQDAAIDEALPTISAAAATASEVPCPTAPTNCASKLNGHLVCLNSRTWCLYTDTTRYTPGFFPVDLDGPCASCLTVI